MMPNPMLIPRGDRATTAHLGRTEREERRAGPPPLEQWKVVTGDVDVPSNAGGAITVTFAPARFIEPPLIPGLPRLSWVTETYVGITYYTGAVLWFQNPSLVPATITWVAMGYSR